MSEFRLPYGRRHLVVNLPDQWEVELLAPNEVPTLQNPRETIAQALDAPLGEKTLSDFAGARWAAVAINDKTRPVPHAVLLPPLLQRLERLGLAPEAITLLVATGNHSPMAPDDFSEVVPADILERYSIVSHDASDQANLVFLGETWRGTPVWVNQRFVEANLRVVVGNIEPHQFMGFSGGVKSAAIGLAGKETIQRNHAMMTDGRARLGHFEDNPARQDVEEIGRLIGVHFAINTVLNEAKEMVGVVAGEPAAVIRQGIPLVREVYQVEVSEPFDLMIASPGGHPKDINLYQSQKALAHAALVTRDGGAIILVAACPEGTGSESYERWMAGITSCEQAIERFRREPFRIGPHKAFQIARDAARVRAILISQMPSDLVKQLLLTPANSLENALSLVSDTLTAGSRVGVMPWSTATIPVLSRAS